MVYPGSCEAEFISKNGPVALNSAATTGIGKPFVIHIFSQFFMTLPPELEQPVRVAWLMAATAMVILVPMVIFMVGQRYFVESVAQTGIKG